MSLREVREEMVDHEDRFVRALVFEEHAVGLDQGQARGEVLDLAPHKTEARNHACLCCLRSIWGKAPSTRLWEEGWVGAERSMRGENLINDAKHALRVLRLSFASQSMVTVLSLCMHVHLGVERVKHLPAAGVHLFVGLFHRFHLK